jgi:hypothetical protein
MKELIDHIDFIYGYLEAHAFVNPSVTHIVKEAQEHLDAMKQLVETDDSIHIAKVQELVSFFAGGVVDKKYILEHLKKIS